MCTLEGSELLTLLQYTCTLEGSERLTVTSYTYIYAVFVTNFLGHQPSGLTASIFMFKSKILSTIRADVNVIFSKIVSPDEKISAIGQRTAISFEHCIWLTAAYCNIPLRQLVQIVCLSNSICVH